MRLPWFPWQEKLPNLLALGYAEVADAQILLRWKSAERVPVANLGDDLAARTGVPAAVQLVPADNPNHTMGCLVEPNRMLVLLALPGNRSPVPTYGYIVAWVDLAALCRDAALPLLRDQVLTATPLTRDEPTPAGASRVSIRDGRATWAVAIARGAQFSQQYGPPTPWLTFLAVGLSALPLLVLASLAGRAGQLRAALHAEREVVRQQRFFTQSVSHEFRTPLGIILSGADLLESYADKLTPTRRSEVLAEIKDNTRHMTEMIERVLLLGRIESSKLSCQPQPVPLAAFCHELARKVATAHPGRGVITVTAPEREVPLDAALVGSMLDNLLSNAVKYSAPGQPVTLEAVVGGTQIVFTVRDEGIGIPPGEVPRVCDPFHRCANVGAVPGTGLGLAIVQRCAALHGGTLKIESAEGHGTTAMVTLPLATSA